MYLAIPPPRYGMTFPPNLKLGNAHARSPGGSPPQKSIGSPNEKSMGSPVEKSMGPRSSGPGRAQIGSGPCKGYVSYMYVHNILYYRRLFDIVLYHPMLCLGSDPILFSSGNLWGSPKATNMRYGVTPIKRYGVTPNFKVRLCMGLPPPKNMGAGWGHQLIS